MPAWMSGLVSVNMAGFCAEAVEAAAKVATRNVVITERGMGPLSAVVPLATWTPRFVGTGPAAFNRYDTDFSTGVNPGRGRNYPEPDAVT